MDYVEHSNNSYASKGVGNTALGLSIGALGVELLGAGAMGLFGNRAPSGADVYTKDLAEKDATIAALNTQQIVDSKLLDVYKELRTQDKNQDAVISNLKDRVTAIEVASPLREQIVLGQVQNVANSVTALNDTLTTRINGTTMGMEAQIADINATLNNITRQIVPSSAVCPQPMPRYNSWTEPTSGT